jgi:thiol:disulfide interchange protein DsbD
MKQKTEKISDDAIANPEIAKEIESFNAEYKGKKTAFIIMQFSKTKAHDKIVDTIKTKLIPLAIGILMLKPVNVESMDLSWENYSKSTLETTIESGQPIIIDFYADWCNPCKELEHITFADPDVQEVLKDFVRFKVDLTVVNDSTNAIRNAFEIPGVPTIIFYNAKGLERKDLRLNGYEKPSKFLKRLEKLNIETR